MNPTPGALGRYRQLLRAATPEQIEQAHAEAFAKLDPAGRQQVKRALIACLEVPDGDSPAALAAAATRVERRSPGALEHALGRTAAPVLSSVATGFVGAVVFSALIFDTPGVLGNGFGGDGLGLGGDFGGADLGGGLDLGF